MSFYGYLFIFFWLHLKKIQKAAFSSSAIASSGVHQPILATQCCAALSLVYMPTPHSGVILSPTIHFLSLHCPTVICSCLWIFDILFERPSSIQ